MRCQATFKEHCTYPKCDCDRDTVKKPRFSEVSPPLSELAQRACQPKLGGYCDRTLVDRDCVMLDGKCNCKRQPGKAFPECEKYGREMGNQ